MSSLNSILLQRSFALPSLRLEMFLTGSWFWRGFQSAIFYYISCAPCTKLNYRRKRRKQLKRERALREAEEGFQQHPTPFSTNPYWKEEIALGPGPPQRKANRDGRCKPKKGKKLRKGGVESRTETGTSSADTIFVTDAGEKMKYSGEGWNKRRYQREDEILWGKEDEDEGNPIGGSPISRSASGGASYYQAKNPAVNDLHPPVVSTQPTHRGETQWMLQPPPRAKIMEGKERGNTPNRSRSGSGTSKDSRVSGKKPESLGRQVGERLMELKLKRGENPATTSSSVAMSRVSSAISTASSTVNMQGQPHDRDTTQLSLSKPSAECMNGKPPPTPPVTIPFEPSLQQPPATRPPLSTIPSSSLPQKPKDRPPHHLGSLLVSTNSASSLQVLQELVAPATQLNTVRTPSSSSPVPDTAVGVKLPPASLQEDTDLRLPELESWWPEGGWEFPRGKSAVESKQRWSMEI